MIINGSIQKHWLFLELVDCCLIGWWLEKHSRMWLNHYMMRLVLLHLKPNCKNIFLFLFAFHFHQKNIALQCEFLLLFISIGKKKSIKSITSLIFCFIGFFVPEISKEKGDWMSCKREREREKWGIIHVWLGGVLVLLIQVVLTMFGKTT